MLPDGTAFAVLSGRFDATLVHPRPAARCSPSPVPPNARPPNAPYGSLDADGGTAIGTWLDLARRLLKDQPAPVKHVLLLTDGRNEHDHRAAMSLDTALDACEGRFVCDAWGIGDDWDAELLLRITRRLHGRARAVPRRVRTDRRLRGIGGRTCSAPRYPNCASGSPPPPGTVIRQVKQVVPSEQELLPVPAGSGGRGAEYVTRAWGDEVRHFQVVLTADPTGRETGEDLQLAAVEVVVPDFGRPVRLPRRGPSWCAGPTTRSDASRQHPGVRRHELYQQASAAVAGAYRAWLRGAEGRDAADRAPRPRALALAGELGDAQLLGALPADRGRPGHRPRPHRPEGRGLAAPDPLQRPDDPAGTPGGHPAGSGPGRSGRRRTGRRRATRCRRAVRGATRGRRATRGSRHPARFRRTRLPRPPRRARRVPGLPMVSARPTPSTAEATAAGC